MPSERGHPATVQLKNFVPSEMSLSPNEAWGQFLPLRILTMPCLSNCYEIKGLADLISFDSFSNGWPTTDNTLVFLEKP
jgi:hypothetical protein